MTFIKVKNGKPGYPYSQGRFLPMLDEVLTDVLGGSSIAAAFNKGAAVNIKEDEKNYFLEFAAPGYEKDEFKIALENQVLSVSAEKKSETKEDGNTYTRREFAFTSFQRSFNLPESVNEEGIKAEYKNGILNVSIPKKVEENKQKKEITVE
jgi:HSP20 family protein